MIFIDTNFFLRFLLHDVPEQYQEAHQLFQQAAKGEVELLSSTVVFFEVSWVLENSFQNNKLEFVATLFKLLQLNVKFTERELLLDSLFFYQNSKLELEDCYNIVFARKQGIEKFKTFDKKLEKEFEKIVGKS